MSNLIFPSLPGLAWNVSKTPMFNTIIQVPGDKRKEVRVSLMPQQQYKFQATFNYLRENRAHSSAAVPDFHLSTLEGFYNARGGAFDSFLLDLAAITHDPASSLVTGQTFGIGDGTTAAFQLTRSVGGFLEELYEIRPNPNIYISDWSNPLNLVVWSEDLTQAVWTKGLGTTITANAAVAPDGTTTADLVTYDGSDIAHVTDQNRVAQTVSYLGNSTPLNGQPYTVSCWLRADSSQTLRFHSSSLGFSVINVGTSWQRYSISGTGAGTGTLKAILQDVAGAAFSVYAWGFQVETNTVASGYAKTTSVGGIGPVIASTRLRKNFLLQSAAFNTSWTATATVTANTTVAPDGTTTADTLNDSSATVFQSVSQAVTIPADVTPYTFSVYVLKTSAATNTFGVNLSFSGGTAISITPRLNTNSGVCSGGGAAVSCGLYWRFSGTLANNGTNTSVTVAIQPATGTNSGTNPGADVAATTGTAVVWGAQLEPSSTVTRYIATTTVAVSLTDYSLGFFQSGIVTFAIAPAAGAVISGDFGWYYRVRFLDDTSSTFNNFQYQLWELQQITFIQTSN